MLKTIGFPASRTGDQTIINGNLVIGTAGKGIDFSADPSTAGMTSELLDDYEEGTWSPAAGSGVTVVGTFSSYGTYTKIGRLVMITGFMQASTSISCAGAGLLVNNLPFAGPVDQYPLGRAITQNTGIFCDIYMASGTGLRTSNVSLSPTLYIFFSITYIAA